MGMVQVGEGGRKWLQRFRAVAKERPEELQKKTHGLNDLEMQELISLWPAGTLHEVAKPRHGRPQARSPSASSSFTDGGFHDTASTGGLVSRENDITSSSASIRRESLAAALANLGRPIKQGEEK